MARSILFITTPTSGTGSLQRLISVIAGKEWPIVQIGEQHAIAGTKEQLRVWKPEPENRLYCYNTPEIWERKFSLRDFRLIINFRDPRDILCNLYYWVFQHPMYGKTEEQTEERRKQVRQMGISKYVRSYDNSILYQPFFDVLEAKKELGEGDCVVLSYNQLCLGFDRLVAKLARFFGRSLTPDVMQIVERECVDNLKNNPEWIGHRWQGADILPGRHRAELDPETIAFLTSRYRKILDLLIELDDPEFAQEYR